MKSLLPLKSRVEPTQDGANVISISEEAADEVFETLSSSTARQILSLLYSEPRPAAELAEETDTTVQNVRYHLDNLLDADLIAVVDTWYSEKGTEMNVYAPTEAAVVLTAGQESTTSRLKSTILELLGSLGIFALASVAVQYLATRYFETPIDDTGEPATPTEEVEETEPPVETDDTEETEPPVETEDVEERDDPEETDQPESPDVEIDEGVAESAADSTVDVLIALLTEPGVVFFAGCLLALVVVVLLSRRG